jgi:hypothetical protein
MEGNMPLIQVPKNVQPRQFEFREGVERSKPGALYFSPGAVKKITKDELEAIRKEDKRYASLLVILMMEDVEPRLSTKYAENKTLRPKDRVSVSKQKQQALLEKAKKKSEIHHVVRSESSNSSSVGGETSKNTISRQQNDNVDAVEFDDVESDLDNEKSPKTKGKKHK